MLRMLHDMKPAEILGAIAGLIWLWLFFTFLFLF